jgi:hypothetical protein
VEDRIGALPAPWRPSHAPLGRAAGGVRESTLIKDRAQAHLVIGFRGLTLEDPDRYALELISQMLAGQGGRLFLELRDRQSLAYTVSASNVEGLAPGHFTLYIATAPEKLERARAGILEEIDDSRAVRIMNRSNARSVWCRGFAINSQRNHSAPRTSPSTRSTAWPDFTELYPRSPPGNARGRLQSLGASFDQTPTR